MSTLWYLQEKSLNLILNIIGFDLAAIEATCHWHAHTQVENRRFSAGNRSASLTFLLFFFLNRMSTLMLPISVLFGKRGRGRKNHSQLRVCRINFFGFFGWWYRRSCGFFGSHWRCWLQQGKAVLVVLVDRRKLCVVGGTSQLIKVGLGVYSRARGGSGQPVTRTVLLAHLNTSKPIYNI